MLTKRRANEIKNAAAAISRALRSASPGTRPRLEAHYAEVCRLVCLGLVKLFAEARGLTGFTDIRLDEEACRWLTSDGSLDFAEELVETIGEAYEHLLKLSPRFARDGSLVLSRMTTKARKHSGSYYTPDSLVSALLDQSFEPLLASSKEPLQLRLIDPSCGTGRFLMAVARRIAAASSAPLSAVVGSCIYGVDTNPVAVEVCMASLCLEAGDFGLAEVLRKRILVGNLLLGASREEVAKGLPDEAYATLDGDDPKLCRSLRLKNAELRDRLHDGPKTLSKEGFDAWCAAFVQRKTSRSIVTESIFTTSPKRSVAKLVEAYQFLHPEFAFSEVMQSERTRGQGIPRLRSEDFESNKSNVQGSCRQGACAPSYQHYSYEDHTAGFDLVIGNPPYVPLYSRKSAKGDKMLSRSANLASYLNRSIEGEPALSGRTNTFLLFLSLGARLAKKGGTVAYVLPDSLSTNESYERTRRALISKGWLRSFTTYREASFGETAVRTCLLVWTRGESGPTVISESDQPGATLEQKTFTKDLLLSRPGASLRLTSTRNHPEGWKKLGDIAEIRDGINPGTQKVRRRIVTESAEELLEPWKKAIVGNDIKPMALNQTTHWVLYNPASVSPQEKKAGTSLRDPRIFETRRIVYRQTASRPIACICPAGVYALNSVHNVLLHEPTEQNLTAVCRYLNTDFCARVYAELTGETRNIFPQVHASSMRQLPIPDELLDPSSKIGQAATEGVEGLNDLLEYLFKNTDNEETAV